MVIDPQQAANYSVGGVVISGTLFWMIRWIIRTFHVDRLANKSTNAESNVIDRLENEIKRLEVIINKQSIDIDNMHREHRRLERRLSNQRAVLIAIETIVEGMCSCNSTSKKRLVDLIAELINADKDYDKLENIAAGVGNLAPLSEGI